MTKRSTNWFRSLFAVALLGGVASAALAADYAPVTDERLKNPEAQNWLSWRGNYASWGYSPLDQITADNVKGLVPVWSYSTGLIEGHQAPPLVNNGMMFVSTPQNNVIALDAKSGSEIWRYRRKLAADLFQLHPTNRGVGLYKDKVYLATLDACVVALDALTGKQAWENCAGNNKNGEYMTLSPLLANGKVVVGMSGGEFGIRGYIVALDADTGKEAWRTYTIPGPGQKGNETWRGDDWKTGGGSIWVQGSYDPATNLAYFGTGNGGPWMPDSRPGDNLYSSSVVAIDLTSGEIKGFHQYHWADAWDWDEVSAPLLIDYQRDGKEHKGIVHAGRNGYLWFLDRTAAGPIKFTDAKPFVKQEPFKSLDEATGRPTYDPSKIPGTGKTVTFCPGLWGGKDWPPEAFNPKTRLLYVPSNQNLCSELGGAPMEKRSPGELWIGVPIDVILTSLRLDKGVDTSKPVPIGQLQAWNVDTGKLAWKHDYMDTATWGPVLTTGGDLVFTGGTADRMFRAFNAKTGEKLWEFPTSSGVNGVPSSFAVDGQQYIAVQSGWGVDAERMHGLLRGLLPAGRTQNVPQGGAIYVFALPKK